MLDSSTLKQADDNQNVATMAKFVRNRVENIVEKGKNADYCHFLLFPP